MKTIKMSYSFYKKYFRECETGEYDSQRKTIEIEVPERIKFPRNWKINGAHRYTPEGIEIFTYGSGYSESYSVTVRYNTHPEAKVPCIHEQQKLINPGVNARQQVLDVVAKFAKIPNIIHSVFEPK